MISALARWHFAGVFFISLCLFPFERVVLSVSEQAAVTIAGLFLGRCSGKWNTPSSCLYGVLRLPGASGWKTGLVFQEPSGIFTMQFSWQFAHEWIFSSAYKLHCLSLLLVFYATTCHWTSTSRICLSRCLNGCLTEVTLRKARNNSMGVKIDTQIASYSTLNCCWTHGLI